MSDYNSSLPVRTENNGDVVSKISDGTLITQLLTVNVDGSVNVTDNGSSLTVDALNLDIRDLSHSQDSIKVGDGTDFVAVNADGSLNITDNGGSLTVDATDLDIRDLSSAQDSVKAQIADSSGTYYSPTNPVPVTVSNNLVGDEINDYNTAAAIAANATSNHDYTVTAGKTLLLSQIEASGSGKMKIEVQTETGVATGVFNSKFVMFNSTSSPNMSLELKAPISVAAGVRVRVIRTNKDNQAQDLYSTICGQEV